jgi:hypothetical protein
MNKKESLLRNSFFELHAKMPNSFFFSLAFLPWYASIIYDITSIVNILKLIARQQYSYIELLHKKLESPNKAVKKKIDSISSLVGSYRIRFYKYFRDGSLKKKFVNKSNSYLRCFFVPYRTESDTQIFFNFKYMWSALWSSTSFFFSSFSNIRYAWFCFKTTRSNYFGTFYYTGAYFKFREPDTLFKLTDLNIKYKVKIIPKEMDELPYKLHPSVIQAFSPYGYVATTASSGTLGLKKKARRSKDAIKNMKEYFDIFYNYYFSFYKIDFLFFRLSGIYRILKFFKNKLFRKFRKNFYSLKRLYKKSKYLKKEINTYDANIDAFPGLMRRLVALMGGQDISKPIIPDQETEEYL